MSFLILSLYVLLWPVIVAAVMFFIGKAFFQEWAEARQQGEDLI